MSDPAPEEVCKTCPDCGKEYVGYADDNCCAACFENFNGMTLEDLEKWLSA